MRRALLATLAASLGPDLRAIVVHGGALDPDALCEQALRALRAEVSDEPRVVFEAYLAHLRSRTKGLALLIEEADAFPPATLDCLAHWARLPASHAHRRARAAVPEMSGFYPPLNLG